MSFNIVDLVKDQISDQLMGQIGGVLGADSAQTSSAIGGALPGLLSGLTGAASNSDGAGALFNAVQKQDDGLLGDLGNLLGGGQSSGLINQGTSLLGSLLGNGALGKIAGALAGFSGLSRGNSSSLMGMLAPIVIGVIKRKVFDGGLNAGSLASMLGGQQANINAAMPQGFSSQLQNSGFFDSIQPALSSSGAAPQAQAQTTQTTQQHTPAPVPAESGGGLMKWLLPLIGIAVLGWLGMKFLGGGAEDATNAVGTATEAASDAASSAADAATEALPDGVDIDAIKGQLDGVFGSTTDALSGITDADTATAAIPALEEATSKLGGVNDLFARLPDAAKGPVSSIVSGGMATLQPILDKVIALPGVGSVVEPVVKPLMDLLKGMAG
ncbi:MAG: DUF937 domain-containing protein [Granulosicoccus sp.]